MSLSDEQASRIEARLDQLVADVSGVKTDVSTLKADVSTLRSDIATIRADVADIQTDVTSIKSDFSTIKAEVVDLRVHMGVLHEEALDHIKLLAEGQQGLREQMARGFKEQDERFEIRFRSLEGVVREHSAELKRRGGPSTRAR